VPAIDASTEVTVVDGGRLLVAIESIRYGVFLGLDVGKSAHHAVALDVDGRRLHDAPLPQDEQQLRRLFQELAEHGSVLIVVDQPANIGALAVAVAQAEGVDVGYLPGLTMRRLADLHPGEAKTDARDAFVIADAARTLPHTLRRVDRPDERIADLTVLIGYDDDLAADMLRHINRLRSLLNQVHPALERVLGPRLQHPAVTALLARFGGPDGLRRAGGRRIDTVLAARAPRLHGQLTDAVLAALTEQSVTVAGTNAAEVVIAQLAASLGQIVERRNDLAKQVEAILEAHPLGGVLTSMPGIGVRTAARILLHVGDASAFPSAAHLAAYAGLAPVTRRSGTSIRGEHRARTGNRQLKRALFLSAFASLPDPASRAYYDRKRAEGKTHNGAVLCLARRRCDVLYAMLRTQANYQPSAAAA
jgi:transposase